MKQFWLIRIALVLAIAALGAWVVRETRWVEVTVDEGQRGAAATDHYYTLRHVLEAGGSTLQVRTSLEPLPPPGATLLLDSSFWNIFPGRSERLQAWVRNGGHLVVQGLHIYVDRDMHWLPLSFVATRAPAASATGDVVGRTLPRARDKDDDDEQVGPVTQDAKDAKDEEREQPADHPFKKENVSLGWAQCRDFKETVDTTQTAFGSDRVLRGCWATSALHAVNGARPTWTLSNPRKGVLAMRVPYGRGSVTGVSFRAQTENRALLQADNALIVAAILQVRPGQAVWVDEDESREALPMWMWHQARTPSLLILAAVLLSLWRLLPRFGPREAAPPQGRRSMGEQVSGTGQFIAAADPRALHDAARVAFEAMGRTRIDDWAGRDDAERVAALSAVLAPATTLDQAALLAALHPSSAATPAQILAAIAVIEQARRALSRAPVSPFAH